MKTKKIARGLLPAVTLLCLALTQPVFSYQSPEAQNFMSGFNSFKNKEYRSAIKQFSTVLGQPDSQLREVTLVFLARAHFKEGNTDEASYLLHLWKKEFPDSTLGTTLESDLIRETAKVDIKTVVANKEQERIAREKAEQELLVALRADEERRVKEKAEAERTAREKATAERLANHKAAIYAKRIAGYPAGDLNAVAGRETTIPLTITNPGVMSDSFALATKLPSGWKSRFEVDGKPISVTPEIAPGSSTRLTLALMPPVNILEGQQLAIPVQLLSRIVGERTITSEIAMVASAPIVRAVVKKLDAVDGDPTRAQCLVSVLNVGSADAATLSVTITHQASHQPVAEGSATYSKLSGETIRLGTLNLPSGGLQEFLINFRTHGKAGISCKADLSLE